MNCKAKGSRIERKAKAQLERQGFQLVVKSGASLGLFDLIAVGVDFDHALILIKASDQNILESMLCG